MTVELPAVPPPRVEGRRPENIPLGIICMLTASIVFQASSALSKWLIVTYPIGEMLFMRAAVSLVVVSAIILPVSGLGVFRTKRLHDHVFRNVSQSTAQALIAIAFSLMPLASAVAITFSAPLFSTIAAIVVLKESVGPVRWGALIVGFLGVLIVTSPGADTVQAGSLFALANAVLFGTVAVGVRRMAATESTETMIMHQMVFLTVFFAASLPFGWVTPMSAGDWAGMIANGLLNAAGLAGLGRHPRISGVGRRAIGRAARGGRHRGGVGNVPAVARGAPPQRHDNPVNGKPRSNSSARRAASR
jgi:drug/metabolite transporter (DMT)-like permease